MRASEPLHGIGSWVLTAEGVDIAPMPRPIHAATGVEYMAVAKGCSNKIEVENLCVSM